MNCHANSKRKFDFLSHTMAPLTSYTDHYGRKFKWSAKFHKNASERMHSQLEIYFSLCMLNPIFLVQNSAQSGALQEKKFVHPTRIYVFSETFSRVNKDKNRCSLKKYFFQYASQCFCVPYLLFHLPIILFSFIHITLYFTLSYEMDSFSLL